MTSRLRLALLLALALAGGVLLGGWLVQRAAAPYRGGMADNACTADGLPLGGRPQDDWAALCRYRATNARQIASRQPVRAVFIGDSLTERWEALDAGSLGADVIGRGISGQTSQQVLLRFGQDAVALHPRVVHILVGTNDITGNTGPFDPAMLEHDLAAMIAQARAGGARVVVGNLPPAHDFFWKPWLNPAPWVPRINARIAAIARREGAVLADYHAVLAQPDGSYRKELFADGAHPNAAGYAAMRAVALKALAEAEAASR